MGDPFGWVPNSSFSPFSNISGLTEVSPTLGAGRNFIAIIYGESLASAHIAADYAVLNPTKIHMVNWAGDRKLYQHKEPMMGASFFSAGETHGVVTWNNPWVSMWGALGDLLIANNVFDRVIWLNYSSGGSQVNAFEPGGAFSIHNNTIFNVLRTLGYSGNQVSAALTMIGANDGVAGTSATNYKQSVRNHDRALRSRGFSGPSFIPVNTYRGGGNTTPALQQAQRDLWGTDGFVAGPDFDVLGNSYRDANGTHQNGLGMTTMAQMWCDCIAARFPH